MLNGMCFAQPEEKSKADQMLKAYELKIDKNYPSYSKHAVHVYT